MTRRAIAGTWLDNQSWNTAQLTGHHKWNMAVESSTSITHDKTECSSSTISSETQIYSRAAAGTWLRQRAEAGTLDFGHIPDATEVKVMWRTAASTWLLTHFGKYRSLRPNCRNLRTPGPSNPESQ